MKTIILLVLKLIPVLSSGSNDTGFLLIFKTFSICYKLQEVRTRRVENENEIEPPAWLGSSVSARINKECEISRQGQFLYSHYITHCETINIQCDFKLHPTSGLCADAIGDGWFAICI